MTIRCSKMRSLKTDKNCLSGDVEAKSDSSGVKKCGRRASRQNTNR